MTVTVYITNYNYERYIRQSIESVLSQTFQDFELLIIDDGSTDNSRDIIEQYRSHEKVRIIFQENKGLNATNNVAIQAARGKYLMRLDADDFLEPPALGIMAALMEADPELGLVFPDYYYVDANNHRIGQERRHHFDDEVTLYDQPAHGACTMIRLGFLKKLGGYDETLSCQDGYELWLKFITFHKVTNISRPLFSYRRHHHNLTTNESKILETRKIIKQKFVSQHFESPKTLAIIPVRSKYFGGANWPLWEYAGRTALEHKVESCLAAQNINHVVVVTAEDDILEFAQSRYEARKDVTVLRRPHSFAAEQVSLAQTVQLALDQAGQGMDLVATVSIDYPFVKPSSIDEAINTQMIFKADSVISVQLDTSTYYRHNGKTLKPILNQDKHTRYEREALFKGVGGVVVATVDSFVRNVSMVSERIAHVVLSQEEALSIHNQFNFNIFKAISLNISNQLFVNHK
jgi:CMP-N-acetylneuraminic acid synthetase